MFREKDIQPLLIVMQTDTVSATVFLFGLRLFNISLLTGSVYNSFLYPASSIRNLLSNKRLLPANYLNDIALQGVNAFSKVILPVSVDVANTTGCSSYAYPSAHPLKDAL